MKFSLSIDKKLLAIYILEGLAIGLVVTSITGVGGVATESISEEKESSRIYVRWIFTVLSILVAHAIGESLRHDRILGLLSDFSPKLSGLADAAKTMMIKTKNSLPSGKSFQNMLPVSKKKLDLPPLPPISIKNIVDNTTKIVPFNENY